MNIFIDENIPYGEDFFSAFGELHFFSGRSVTAEQLREADVLLVRSITQVNASLLHLNERIQFVGTATIGTDHIDQHYLAQRNIRFSSAPGCNKISVADYILSSLLVLTEKLQFQLAQKTVAIVGAGNTGSAVYERLQGLGVNCKLYDPPLQQSADPRQFCQFDEVLAADIISLHVPKIIGGEFPTLHMFNEQVLSQLRPEQILLNASRGEVIDNQALLTLAKAGRTPTLVLDVWENEPNVEAQLLPYVEIATPHIAGYSLDGKARGTEMLYHALCAHLQRPVECQAGDFVEAPALSSITVEREISEALLKRLVHLVFDVRRDDALFRQMIDQPDGFDIMRKTYSERREMSTLSVNAPASQSQLLQALGFTTTR